MEPTESFPEKAACERCRREMPVTSLRIRTDVLLSKVILSCPNCRKVVIEMRLKDWYDHYIHGTTPPTVRPSSP